MTLELANRAICTLARIARDVFVPVGKFTFPADFVIVDYESDPRFPLILGRPFLRTARTLIDVHREEMILRDGDERLILNMRHDTSSYSNKPKKESINMIDIYNVSHKDYLEDLFANEKATNHQSGNPTFSSHTDLTSPEIINPLKFEAYLTSDSFPSRNDDPVDLLLEEFADELALITFPPGNDDLPFDIEFDLREIEYLLNHDPTKEMDSILEDSIDEGNLADPNNDLVDTIPKMFTDEHTLDYSSPPLYNDVDDNLVELESDNDDVYDDPFDSKEDKIKESKLLIDELDPPRSSDFLPSPKCDSVFYEDFSEVDTLTLTGNEDKVFNPGILIHENLFEVTIRVTNCAKNVKKTNNASLILEDFNPPLYELPLHKEVLRVETLLSFSSQNKEKVFNPGILTFKGVHTSLLSELSHRGPKAFKVIKIFESPMEIFPFSYGEDIRVLDVSCLNCTPIFIYQTQDLEKFIQPEFEGYGVKVNKDVSENVSKEVKKNSDAPVTEDWVSDCDEDETIVLKSLNVQKPKQADQPRKANSINTAKGKRMTSAVGKQGINVVKPTTYSAWRPKIKMINHVYKNIGSCIMTEAKDSKVCKITRADGSSIFHGDIQALLRRLDRQDLNNKIHSIGTYNDDLPFDIKSNLREIEYLLNHDRTKEMDSILDDSIDEGNLVDPNNDLVDTIPEIFTDEHTLDYSSPPLYDDVDDNLVELESDNDDV
ncbi:reverse transcriptase domain-containing protein [Tanacetum coccineum]